MSSIDEISRATPIAPRVWFTECYRRDYRWQSGKKLSTLIHADHLCLTYTKSAKHRKLVLMSFKGSSVGIAGQSFAMGL